jgi:hypothetical protein
LLITLPSTNHWIKPEFDADCQIAAVKNYIAVAKGNLKKIANNNGSEFLPIVAESAAPNASC